MSHRLWVLLALLAAVLTAERGRAQTVLWNETNQGDLSNNQAAPNQFTVGPGVHSVIGSVTNNVGLDPRDFLTLTIPTDRALTSMTLVTYVSADALGFAGVQAGTSFVGSLTDPANYLGYSHFGPGNSTVGVDILPLMGQGAGSQGFTPPLPAGSYTFVLQQTGTALTEYRFDFGVASVPEPAALALIPTAAGAYLLWRRRRAQRML
jgi:hypothetical protein